MGIRHTVPSGLPTGTVAGKVAGDDWRADHLHVPFEVSLFTAPANAGVALLPASAAVNTEVFATSKVTRNKIDLSQASQCRLVLTQIAAGNVTGAAVKMQYMTTNTGTWSGSDLTASASSLVLGASGNNGIIMDTGWVNLAAGAKIDNCYIALAVAVAFGTTGPSVGGIKVFFR